MKTALPPAQVRNIARGVALDPWHFVLECPPEQASNCLNSHIGGLREVTLAITQYANRLRGQFAERNIGEHIRRAWCYRFGPGMLQDLPPHVLCLRVQISEICGTKVLLAKP